MAFVTVPVPDRGVVETAAGTAAVARERDDRDRQAAAVENAAAGAGRRVCETVTELSESAATRLSIPPPAPAAMLLAIGAVADRQGTLVDEDAAAAGAGDVARDRAARDGHRAAAVIDAAAGLGCGIVGDRHVAEREVAAVPDAAAGLRRVVRDRACRCSPSACRR